MENTNFLKKDFDLESLRVKDLREILRLYDVHAPSSTRKAGLIQLVETSVRGNINDMDKREARGLRRRQIEGDSAVEEEDEALIHHASHPHTHAPTAIITTPPKSFRTKRGSTSKSKRSDLPSPPGTLIGSGDELPLVMGPSKGNKGKAPAPPSTIDTLKNPFQSSEEEEEITNSPKGKGNKKKSTTSATAVKRNRSTTKKPLAASSFSSTATATTTATTTPVPKKRSVRVKRSSKVTNNTLPATGNMERMKGRLSSWWKVFLHHISGTKKKVETSVRGFKSPSSRSLRLRSMSNEDLTALALMDQGEEEEGEGIHPRLHALFLFLVTLLIIYVGWYRVVQGQMGYCDTGSSPHPPSNSLYDQLPQWTRPFQPHCFPCPSHATHCSKGQLHGCQPGYVEKPPFLSSLWPRPVRCVPDTIRERRIVEFVQSILQTLEDRSAHVLCSSESPRKARISLPDLRAQFHAMSAVSEEVFEDCWTEAIRIIQSGETHEDLAIRKQDGTITLSHRSPSLPLLCRARLYAGSWLMHHIHAFISITLSVGLFFWFYFQISSWIQDKRTVRHLVDQTLALLTQQGTIASSIRLRDGLLKEEHSLPRRIALWDKVTRLIEQNGNVITEMKEVEGEVHRCWTWKGSEV
ncbi:MAG: Man1-Src1p-C-terminal domain-containing protein [Piptocephalis tieghemiana]|nr:MAG: Man1-Src1p-C-terminal domain-containing protein [Piptocephalis tieghemiana]